MNINPYILPRTRLQFAACMTAVFVPAVVFAQTAVRDERVAPPARDVRVVEPARPLKKIDRDFVEKAAKTSMTEIQISRVAAARTSNPEVRRFAQMMVDDHEKAIDHLAALASAYSIPLPAKEPHPAKWEKHDAKDFDKDYLDKMVSDHEDAVKLFQNQAKSNDDTETVAYARKHLPKLQQHLQHALDLKRSLSENRDRR
jgi:putative membrane protein